VKSVAPAEFWRHYKKLPLRAQKLADRYFAFFSNAIRFIPRFILSGFGMKSGQCASVTIIAL
jgi:hypothetical protein